MASCSVSMFWSSIWLVPALEHIATGHREGPQVPGQSIQRAAKKQVQAFESEARSFWQALGYCLLPEAQPSLEADEEREQYAPITHRQSLLLAEGHVAYHLSPHLPLVCAHFQELEMYADKLGDLICNLMTSQEETSPCSCPLPWQRSFKPQGGYILTICMALLQRPNARLGC